MILCKPGKISSIMTGVGVITIVALACISTTHSSDTVKRKISVDDIAKDIKVLRKETKKNLKEARNTAKIATKDAKKTVDKNTKQAKKQIKKSIRTLRGK